MTVELAALNGICPYFTMFPLEFPMGILKRRAKKGQSVLDPFCGRGTTNFAARLVGLNSLGVDASPVAVAIAASKMVSVDPSVIALELDGILNDSTVRFNLPQGDFWDWAYEPNVLATLSKIRAALILDCLSPGRIALRGILLGALHGPKQKTFQSYLSNQCPRTYAPKPTYALNFWRNRNMLPHFVDISDVVNRRAKRYYSTPNDGLGTTRLGDSRLADDLIPPNGCDAFDWVITSPPYYGMRTYMPDQWLRSWFLGGPDTVEYVSTAQLQHSSPEDFANSLKQVWMNTRAVVKNDTKMVIRFGGIRTRNLDPAEIVKSSLAKSGWRISTMRSAGLASEGKRQADSFLRIKSQPVVEYDIWASPV